MEENQTNGSYIQPFSEMPAKIDSAILEYKITQDVMNKKIKEYEEKPNMPILSAYIIAKEDPFAGFALKSVIEKMIMAEGLFLTIKQLLSTSDDYFIACSIGIISRVIAEASFQASWYLSKKILILCAKLDTFI
jgi:hypothetical protein